MGQASAVYSSLEGAKSKRGNGETENDQGDLYFRQSGRQTPVESLFLSPLRRLRKLTERISVLCLLHSSPDELTKL